MSNHKWNWQDAEMRWKKIKETTKFYTDASVAIFMDYDMPEIFKLLREMDKHKEGDKSVQGNSVIPRPTDYY